jgi:hypothetical protein
VFANRNYIKIRRTEGSSKEEQIIQKEQILAELQRVEKELQEKAQAQLLLSGEQQQQQGVRGSTKREAGEGQRGAGEGQEEIQPPAPFNFALDQQGTNMATTEVKQTINTHLVTPVMNQIQYLDNPASRIQDTGT